MIIYLFIEFDTVAPATKEKKMEALVIAIYLSTDVLTFARP
jgi:hypothetical protein